MIALVPDPASAEKARQTCAVILEILQEHRQRATYGAFASVVGGTANGVMYKKPKNPLHSWIVSADTSQPTGYVLHQKHPDLEAPPTVHSDSDSLRGWLRQNS